MAATMTRTRTWTVTLPARPARSEHWLTANRTKNRGHAKRLVDELQDAAIRQARASCLPPIQRARIVAVYEPPTNQRHDPANLAPTAKAYVDGLVRAGVLTDDSTEYLIGPDMRTGCLYQHPQPRLKLARIVLHIAELPPIVRMACISVKAAAAVEAETRRSGFGDPHAPGEYRVRADGKTAAVMYTDPSHLVTLAKWAFGAGHITELTPEMTGATS